MEFPMPMPILTQVDVGDRSTDLRYLSFADAQVLPFANNFQPSFELTTFRVAAKKKKIVVTKQLDA